MSSRIYQSLSYLNNLNKIPLSVENVDCLFSTKSFKSELLKQIGQARILHQLDYISLINFKKTYDPFEIMQVCDDTLVDWVFQYNEKLLEAKKKPKKGKNV